MAGLPAGQVVNDEIGFSPSHFRACADSCIGVLDSAPGPHRTQPVWRCARHGFCMQIGIRDACHFSSRFSERGERWIPLAPAN